MGRWVAMMADYRFRIYANYVRGRENSLAPSTIEGLRPRAPYLKKLIREHFPASRDAMILDLGCGYGALLHFANLAGYGNIWGVDISSEQVWAAERLGIGHVRQGDLLETLRSQPDGSCDAVVAFDTIEHFRKEEAVVLVDEARRILKPGGKWIIHTANAESPFGPRIFFGDFTHETFFTRVSIAQLLLSSGFSRVMSFEDVPVVHGLKSAMRWVLWQVVRSILRFYLAAETGSVDKRCVLSQNFLTTAVK